MEGPSQLIAEWTGEHVIRHEFEFTTKVENHPASSPRRFFRKLVAFRGKALSREQGSETTVAWELIPLSGSSPTISPGCDILLDGVP
jgi:hypothetical protein